MNVLSPLRWLVPFTSRQTGRHWWDRSVFDVVATYCNDHESVFSDNRHAKNKLRQLLKQKNVTLSVFTITDGALMEHHHAGKKVDVRVTVTNGGRLCDRRIIRDSDSKEPVTEKYIDKVIADAAHESNAIAYKGDLYLEVCANLPRRPKMKKPYLSADYIRIRSGDWEYALS